MPSDLDALAARARKGFEEHIAANGLPWRVVSVGAKGCVAFTGAPVRNAQVSHVGVISAIVRGRATEGIIGNSGGVP